MANFDIIEYQKRVINDLSAENKALKDRIDELNSSHIKIQYHNEELTVQELCERLERAEHDRDRAINQLKGDCRICAHVKHTWNNGAVVDCPLWNNCSNGDKWEWYCEED